MKKFAAVTITLVMVLSLMFGIYSVFADEAVIPETDAETVSDEMIISESVGAAPVEAVLELNTQVQDTSEINASELEIIYEETPQTEDIPVLSESSETTLNEDVSFDIGEYVFDTEISEETSYEEILETIPDVSESNEDSALDIFEETTEIIEVEEKEDTEETESSEVSEETEEAEEPEASEVPELLEDAELELSAFEDGGIYVITFEVSGITYAVTNNSGTIIAEALASIDEASDGMKWTCEGTSKAGLTNGGIYLYYNKSSLTLISNSSAKSNWTISGTSLYYKAGGDSYYISGLSGNSVAISKDSADALPCSIKGVDGTNDPESGSDDSGSGDGGSSSSSTYNELDTKSGKISTAYIAIVDPSTGTVLYLDQGSFGTKTVTVTGDKGSRTTTLTKGIYIEVKEVEGGLTLRMQDPPDNWNYIFVKDGVLTADDKDNPGEATSFNNWHLDSKGKLYYDDNGTRYYLCYDGSLSAKHDGVSVLFGGDTANSGGGGGGGSKSSEIVETDASGPQITEQPEVTPYMTEGSGYAAPVYKITAALPADSNATSMVFTWYINGEAQPAWSVPASAGESITSTYTAVSLADKSFGVYPVYCVVSCDVASTGENGSAAVTTHSNTSITVNFIVCKGINSSQFLTYSDVHETFSNIGHAINNIMTGGEGLIPALVICTGDWANGRYMGGEEGSENYNTVIDQYISRLIGQSGGIDTVYVAGNHDNTAAARAKNLEAGLGAKEEDAESGVIFDSKAAAENGTSSKEMNNLLVYGINFENIKTDSGYSYERVLPDLEKFLEETRADYAGQLIVISAHAGLHVLADWGGNAEYNVDMSSDMVKLLNSYAATGMNIMFLFGHDHSKGESELLKIPGDTLTSTISFDEKTMEDNEILFTYGHAGYITNNSGGNKRYSVVGYTDLAEKDAVVTRELYTLDSDKKGILNEENSKEIPVAGEKYLLTEYQITEGAGSEWTTGDDGITMHANGSLDVFTGILVDGKLIDEKYYTAESGSTIITLKPEYLGTLTTGMHNLTIQFSNGEADAVFNVENNKQETETESEPEPEDDNPDIKPSGDDNGPDNRPSGGSGRGGNSVPKTGDDNNAALWILLIALSFTAIVSASAVVIKKR